MDIPPLPLIMIEPVGPRRLAGGSRPRRRPDHRRHRAGRARTAQALVARQPGVVAGLDFAATAFRLIDPAIKVDVALPDGSRLRPGDLIATISGPGPRHPDSGTNGAELPVPPQRRRLRHARHRRRDRGHPGAGLLHAQDHARAALRAEIRRAGRRRLEPPVRPG